MTTTRHKTLPRFAICVNTDDPDLLTPRMVYQVLPDDRAAKSNYVRVIDNEGEDYLYPADYFVLVNLPQAAKQVLLRTATTVPQQARSARNARRPVVSAQSKMP